MSFRLPAITESYFHTPQHSDRVAIKGTDNHVGGATTSERPDVQEHIMEVKTEYLEATVEPTQIFNFEKTRHGVQTVLPETVEGLYDMIRIAGKEVDGTAFGRKCRFRECSTADKLFHHTDDGIVADFGELDKPDTMLIIEHFISQIQVVQHILIPATTAPATPAELTPQEAEAVEQRRIEEERLMRQREAAAAHEEHIASHTKKDRTTPLAMIGSAPQTLYTVSQYATGLFGLAYEYLASEH